LTKAFFNVIIIKNIKQIIFGDFIGKMTNNFINGDMMRGHIDTIILLSLVNGDKHTNEIRDEIETKAGGKYKVKQGTFYSALQRLSKQGFVSEYRSSTADSIRRKYFHLTEKGKAYVEENVDKWNYSKTVIDDLISDEPQETEEKIVVTPTNNAETEFEELLKNSDKIEDFDVSTENDELDDYFKQLNSTLQSEYADLTTNVTEESEIIETKEEKVDENKDFFDKLLETTDVRETDFAYSEERFEELLAEEPEDSNSTYSEEEFKEILSEDTNKNLETTEVLEENIDYTDEIEENISILDEEETILEDNLQEESIIVDNTSTLTTYEEEFSLEKELSSELDIKEESPIVSETNLEEEITVETIVSEEETINGEKTEEIIEDISEEKLEEETEMDTSYASDDKFLFGKDENKELYSDLLDTLFSSSEYKKDTIVEEKEPVVDSTVLEDAYSFETILEDTTEIDNKEEIIEPEEEKEEVVLVDTVSDTKPAYTYSINKEKYNSSFKVDYSDIVSYARQEGFKVRTSYTTNKSEIGKVLINKLSFHASLFFFILAILELCVLFFVFKPSTILNINFYIITALAVFAFLLLNAIIYFVNKGRAISKLVTFKNSLEFVFIVCLNLILLICAFAIISDINFGKAEDLVRYIIIPILMVLNIPAYFIIKYLLLEKNIYYTK